MKTAAKGKGLAHPLSAEQQAIVLSVDPDFFNDGIPRVHRQFVSMTTTHTIMPFLQFFAEEKVEKSSRTYFTEEQVENLLNNLNMIV